MVVFFHGFTPVRSENVAVHESITWLRRLSDLGNFGVSLFFAISGYCIAANLKRYQENGMSARHFIADRFLRIYPSYWVACCISFFVMYLVSSIAWRHAVVAIPKDLATLVGNVFLIEPYVRCEPYLWVSWTLVYEFGFYLLAAFGFALYRRWSKLPPLIVLGYGLAVVGLLMPPNRLLFVLRYWPGFYCGGMALIIVSFGRGAGR